MSLLEKFIVSFMVFLALYIVISLSLRLFEITTAYYSHMIGGIVAIIVGMLVFMYLLVAKKK